MMPSQLFRVTRAPEAPPITPQQIRRMISGERGDSEWDVQEVGPHGSAADYLAMLKEANRHIEALAAVRGDNDWDMSSAKAAREKIVNAWKNRAI